MEETILSLSLLTGRVLSIEFLLQFPSKARFYAPLWAANIILSFSWCWWCNLLFFRCSMKQVCGGLIKLSTLFLMQLCPLQIGMSPLQRNVLFFLLNLSVSLSNYLSTLPNSEVTSSQCCYVLLHSLHLFIGLCDEHCWSFRSQRLCNWKYWYITLDCLPKGCSELLWKCTSWWWGL